MEAESIDIYINYTCNYRCVHCFLGEALNSKLSFTNSDVVEIVDHCIDNYKTNEVVLLGGEPTLHKEIHEIIHNIYDRNIENIRLITNGGLTCERFINNYDGNIKPKIVFSVDGANSSIHDDIRGEGAFDELVDSIQAAIDNGFQFDAICSICDKNYMEVCNILDFLDEYGFGSVTFHYVTPRGEECSDIQVSPDEWLGLKQTILEYRNRVDLSIRFDTIFFDKENVDPASSCRIKDKSNLMFFPDRSVYVCGLYIGSAYDSGFSWKDSAIIENNSNSEISSATECGENCSGMSMIMNNSNYRDQAYKYSISCMYDKEKI